MIALSLGLGLKEWVFRPRLQLILGHPTRPDEVSGRVVTKWITNGEACPCTWALQGAEGGPPT